MSSKFRDALNFYKDYDLCRIGEYYEATSGEETEIIPYLDLEDGNWENAEFWDFDEDVRCEALLDLLKPAPHYLVLAHNCRWNGASGYTIVNSVDYVVCRDYGVSIYPVAVSRGGKCLVCREFSHDVPMGARTTIIALTEREYELLSHWDASWEYIQSFAERYEGCVA